MNHRKHIVYPLLTLAAAFGIAALLVVNRPAPAGDAYLPPPPTVRTVVAAPRAEYLTVRSQGTVQPRTESQLLAELPGRVTWVSPALVPGGAFEADQPLLRIDPADYDNAVRRGEAALARAEAEWRHAGEELARLRELESRDLASQARLDEARRRHRFAEAGREEARVALRQARLDRSRTEIRAPYRGRVRSEQVDRGQFVSRGTEVATVFATDYAEIRLPIASQQLSYLDIDQGGRLAEAPPAPVAVHGEYGNNRFTWTGELVRTEAEIDSRSRMLYAVARIRNPEGDSLPPLAVGLFVQADIRGRRVDSVVRLPRSALRDANQVLVVDGDGRLAFREVSVLRLERDDVLVSGGLAAGERVCVSPLQTVVEGMRVRAIGA